MKYKVSVYPESFKGKDKSYMNASAKKITKLIPKYSHELSVAELAAAIENMQVFCPAVFIGDHKSQDELSSIQFFALDFDGGIDIDTAINRAEQYKLPIAVMYETSSSVNWSKFRLIFLCCQEVNDKNLAVLIQYCLCTIFPEVDNTSKDFCKLYYPGKNIRHQEVTFNIFDLLISTLQYLNKNDPGNKVRILNNIAKKSNVVLRNNTFAVKPHSVCLPSGAPSLPPPASDGMESFWEEISKIEDFRAITIYNNMVDATKSSKILDLAFSKTYTDCYKYTKNTECKKQRKLLRTDIKSDTVCRLLNDFKSGKALEHAQWFGLALNLIHIKGGRALITNTFNEYHDIYNDIDRKEEQVNFAVRNEYHAQNCDDFCPYAGVCDHCSNIVYTLKTSTRKIIKLEQETVYKDIKEMRAELKQAVSSTFGTPGMNIIKAPTGAGKTYAYLEAVKLSDKQTVVAVPNKMLMNAVAMEAKAKGIDYITTPIIEDYLRNLDSSLADRIRHNYEIGNERAIHSLFRESDDLTARKYIQATDNIRKFNGKLIITTHARLLRMKTDYLNTRNVIIDEDILPTIMQIKQIRISDIQDILFSARDYEDIDSEIVNKLEDMMSINGYARLAGINMSCDDPEAIKLVNRIAPYNNSAVFPALRANYFYHEASKDEVYFMDYCSRQPLCNCTIVSATINERLYNELFGGMINSITDLGQLKYEGKLYLHHDCTYSKSCLLNDNDIMIRLRKKYEDKRNIITFKDFARYGELYLGAAQGSNALAGCDLAVIGTFHRPEYVYKLWAMEMGYFDPDDTLANRIVERNGYRFQFMTFENDLLREIQLYMIESESEQAVGRARLVSNNCTVDLYSNLPLKQCIVLDN